MAEVQRERKRRKWDVAAPVPLTSGTSTSLAQKPAAAASQAQIAQAPQTAVADSASEDVKPPVPQPNSSAPTADVIARAKLGAMSVLEKINKDLRAKGSVPMKVFGLKADEDRIRRDVVINDAPGPIRYNLTRRVTQDDIARRTGTQIVVRGQYQPPGVPSNTDELPLFLKVTPGAVSQEEDSVQQYAVDVAAGEVQHILNGGTIGTYRHPVPPPASITGASTAMTGPGYQARPQVYPPTIYPGGAFPNSHPQSSYPPPYGIPQPGATQAPRPSYANVPPPDQALQQQRPRLLQPVPLYVGIPAPPEYDLVGKIRGPGDSFLGHIAGKSGAQVGLKGMGSGTGETGEPLHILVSATSQQTIDEAVRLANNLLNTIREDFRRSPYSMPTQASAYGQAAPESNLVPRGYVAQHPRGAMPQGHAPAMSHPPHSYLPSGGPYAPPAQQHAPYNTSQPYQPPSGPYSNPAHVPYNNPSQPPGSEYMQPGQYQQQWPNQPGYNQLQGNHATPPMQQSTVLNHISHPMLQTSQASQQQLGHAPVSQANSQQATANQFAPAVDGISSNNQVPKASETREEQQEVRRKRFKEFKDTPLPVPSQPAPYAPAPMGPPLSKNSTSMGPPPPRNPSSMGPPPPRNPTSMGPPPPRPSQSYSQGSGKANDSTVSGSLAGLVDYD